MGLTLIGMHLRRVAVPVRLSTQKIVCAAVTAARTRPKLIAMRSIGSLFQAARFTGGTHL